MSCSVCEGTGTGEDPCPKCGNIPMPADLKQPFAESCCDGGACSTAESAQPCGCDMGAKPKPYYCAEHRWRPQTGQCCVNGCRNLTGRHLAFCDQCWDAMENV